MRHTARAGPQARVAATRRDFGGVQPSYIPPFNEERTMAKGEQKSNKMTKKPKKDTSPPPESSSTSTRPMPPTTSVLPKGKLKNK